MILGVDIGGTTINFGLVDKKEVVKKVTVPSFEKNATQSQTLAYLGDRIAEILEPGVEKIGIGVPSVTDPVKGIVYDAANIPSWDVVPLKEVLEKRFGIPVFVNNDANCYAVGAAALVKQPAHVVVTVTLGTGTGVGIVIDGVLFTINYEFDAVIPDGEYPIDLSLIEATDADVEDVDAVVVDGAIIFDNTPLKGDVDDDGIVVEEQCNDCSTVRLLTRSHLELRVALAAPKHRLSTLLP